MVKIELEKLNFHYKKRYHIRNNAKINTVENAQENACISKNDIADRELRKRTTLLTNFPSPPNRPIRTSSDYTATTERQYRNTNSLETYLWGYLLRALTIFKHVSVSPISSARLTHQIQFNEENNNVEHIQNIRSCQAVCRSMTRLALYSIRTSLEMYYRNRLLFPNTLQFKFVPSSGCW